MGKIYFNPKNGKFWESSLLERKPPEGYIYTDYEIDYRWPKRYYLAESFYCPEHKQYEYIIGIRRTKLTVSEQYFIKFTEKYGCTTAGKLIFLGRAMGGRSNNYELAEKLMEKGLFLKWYDRLIKLSEQFGYNDKSRLTRKIVRLLIKGADENAINAIIITDALNK